MISTHTRPACFEDAAALAAFLKALNYFHRINTKSPAEMQSQVEEHLRRLLADSSHSIFLVENERGDVLGYVNVHWLPYLFLPGPEGYVSELFVAEAARGLGIGTQLLEVVKEEAKIRGCSRLSLLNMRDRESYERAFYAKNGWQERDDAANFLFDMR